MSMIFKSLAWAVLIIAAASAADANGLSDSASFAVIAGLAGAAVGSLYGSRHCTGGCWL